MTTITARQAKDIIEAAAIATIATTILGHKAYDITRPDTLSDVTFAHLMRCMGRAETYLEIGNGQVNASGTPLTGAVHNPLLRACRTGQDVANAIIARYRDVKRESITVRENAAGLARLIADFERSFTAEDEVDNDILSEIATIAAERAGITY